MKKRKCGMFRKMATGMGVMSVMASVTATNALAFGDASVSISDTENASADDLMGRVIGILLTIARYLGVALIIYGVYEVVMSFMQNQPEAKTKGIVMALCGAVMTALKSVLQGVGVVG